MGTYSDLIPDSYYNGEYHSNLPWRTYVDTSIPDPEDEFIEAGYRVSAMGGNRIDKKSFSFKLPATADISGVQLQLYALGATYPGYLYVKLTKLEGPYTTGNATAEVRRYISEGSSYTPFTFTIPNISLGETERFFVTVSAEFNTRGDWDDTEDSTELYHIRATVTYRDPPQPSVTASLPNNANFSDLQSFEYSWTVSNGTQTSAVVQESTDGSTWSDVGSPVSGAVYTAPGTARYTASSGTQMYYWRVVVTFSDGTTVTSSPANSYSVLEPHVPPEPDDPPTIVAPSAHIVQPDGLNAVFANTYIAGISKCKVAVSASQGTNPIRSVSFTYPEYSGIVTMEIGTGDFAGKYVGTTPLALPNSTTFTVRVTDTTGLWVESTVSVTVTPYAKPTISISNLIRCNADTSESRIGKYFLINAAASCSSVDNKNSITSFTAVVKDSGNTPYDLLNYQSTDFLSNADLTNEDSLYVIVVHTEDLVGNGVTIERSLPGRLRDVVFKRDVQHNTAHVGVGMTPAGSERTTVQLPTDGTIIIGGKDLIEWLQDILGESFPGWNQNQQQGG